MEETSVSGPYKYDGDMHPSFRIDGEGRIIASVYASDGDLDKAEKLALKISEILSSSTRGE